MKFDARRRLSLGVAMVAALGLQPGLAHGDGDPSCGGIILMGDPGFTVFANGDVSSNPDHGFIYGCFCGDELKDDQRGTARLWLGSDLCKCALTVGCPSPCSPDSKTAFDTKIPLCGYDAASCVNGLDIQPTQVVGSGSFTYNVYVAFHREFAPSAQVFLRIANASRKLDQSWTGMDLDHSPLHTTFAMAAGESFNIQLRIRTLRCNTTEGQPMYDGETENYVLKTYANCGKTYLVLTPFGVANVDPGCQ